MSDQRKWVAHESVNVVLFVSVISPIEAAVHTPGVPSMRFRGFQCSHKDTKSFATNSTNPRVNECGISLTNECGSMSSFVISFLKGGVGK